MRQEICTADAAQANANGYPPIKTAVEWLAALVLLLATAPLMALGAAMVKLTSCGPALYRQTRLGRGGKPFTMYKLRTMRDNCEAQTGAVWAADDDQRVTRVGRFLRATHWDELPQLWNVLKGEMSLIGPRPERPELVEHLERALPGYRQRLRVRPGLTGLAQVQLPADTDLEDVRRKLAYDIYYVSELSFSLDLRILLCTVFHLSGLLLNALGELLVKPYRNAIEPHLGGRREARRLRSPSTLSPHALSEAAS